MTPHSRETEENKLEMTMIR